MPNVFVVMGATGEYSDHSEWPIAAYLDEATAQTHVQLAQSRANEIRTWRNEKGQEAYLLPYAERPRNEYDYDMQSDYSGTMYYLIAVLLLDSVPGVVIEAPLPVPDVPNTSKPIWERLDEDDE